MKKILFDLWKAQPDGLHKFHGGGEYIKSVFHNLIEKYSTNYDISVFYDQSLFIDDWIVEKTKKLVVYNVKNIDDVQKVIDKERPDVFYSGLAYLYGKLKIPAETFFCGTIHGLRTIELPCDKKAYKYFKFPTSLKIWTKYFFSNVVRKRQIDLFKESLKNLDGIVCVSNHTMYAVKNFFPSMSKSIECFYTPQKIVTNLSIEQYEIADKFILLISCDRFEKNSYRAIMALDSLFDKGLLANYKVVTVGKLPNGIYRSIVNIERFIQLDYVSTEKLESLYANCDFFLYPTLNEGFGMPPLEAMKYGKTCVVSAICSVPEICGDVVYYINPYDICEIQNRILMAAEKKISKEKIENHLTEIYNRQKMDLENLCRYILESKKQKC